MNIIRRLFHRLTRPASDNIADVYADSEFSLEMDALFAQRKAEGPLDTRNLDLALGSIHRPRALSVAELVSGKPLEMLPSPGVGRAWLPLADGTFKIVAIPRVVYTRPQRLKLLRGMKL